jgi:hypothetical protein
VPFVTAVETLLDQLGGSPIATLRTIPRSAGDADGGTARDQDLLRRTAAATSTYHRLSLPDSRWPALVHGGLRDSSSHRLELIAGGPGVVLPAGGGAAWVTLHAGSRAVMTDRTALSSKLAKFGAWCRLGVRLDECQLTAESASAYSAFPTLDDGLLSVWDGPLSWLLVARPLPAAKIHGYLDQEIQLRWEEGRRKGITRFIDALLEGQQIETLARYLLRSIPYGLWQVDLLAGADSPEAAVQVATLLAASIDRVGVPYVIDVAPVDSDAQEPEPWTSAVSSEMLARLCAVPVAEVPGVRLALRSTFDVSPEEPVDDPHPGDRPDASGPEPVSASEDASPARVVLGDVLDHQGRQAETFTVPLSTLNRHTFICGATGSGKSQTTRHLLTQLTEAGIPWLVIEPAKAEYRRMYGRIAPRASLAVIRPGQPDLVPAGLNPLEPEPGFPIQTHLDLVRALFVAAFPDAEQPFPQVLAESLTRCYQKLGWDMVLSQQYPAWAPPSYPTLADLEEMAPRVVAEIGYDPEGQQRMTGYMNVRLASLRLGTTGRFFEGGHRLDIADLLTRNCVVEIEDVGDDQDKAFLIGTFLVRMVEHLRVKERSRTDGGTPSLRHVTVIEEAHRLLRRHKEFGLAAMAVELFANLLAEVRAYGEGVVVAEQIPAKIVSDVIKNSALKVIHRLPAEDDRQVVGATVNLSQEQSEFVVSLSAGQAAVARDGMDHPVLVRVPLGEGQERVPERSEMKVPPLAASANVSCGEACLRAPCDLRLIQEARQLARSLDLDAGVELVILSTVTGNLLPEFRERWLTGLRDASGEKPRHFDCALAQTVDRRVGALREALVREARSGVTPNALAQVVVAATNGAVAGTYAGSSWRIEGWALGVFRWLGFVRDLNARGETDQSLPWPDGLPGRSVGSAGEQRDAAREVLTRLFSQSDALQLLSSPGAQDGFARLNAAEHEQIAVNLGWRRELSDYLGWLYAPVVPAVAGDEESAL